jgi:hypothetical protein
MSGPLLKSLAKEVLQELPPTKPEGLENALLRKGVKPEELKFMRLGTSPEEMKAITSDIPAMLDPKGRIHESSLRNLDRERKDVFGEQVRADTSGDVKYRGIIPMDANLRWQPNSYKERIITFAQPQGTVPPGTDISGHFPGLDYLMHTRSYDELISGADTKVVTEIQSDLHQRGMTEEGLLEAPWKSSWMRKGLENEILHAIKEGKQQIAVPVKNSAAPMYSPELLSEIQASDFSEAITYIKDQEWPSHRVFKQKVITALPDHLKESKSALDVPIDLFYDSIMYGDISGATLENFRTYMSAANFGTEGNVLQSLSRSEGVQKWYETSVAPTAQKLAKQMGAEYKVVNQDGIEYAVIDLAKGANTKNFNLYAGGAPLAAYMAYQEGYSEDEVRAEMLNRGFTEEEIADSIAKIPQVAEAKAQDYTDEEITAFFAGQQPKADSEDVQVKDVKTNEQYMPPADTGDAKSDSAYLALTGKRELSAKELVVALQTVHPDMSSITTRLSAFFGDEDAAIKAQRTEAAVVEKIKQGFASRGAQAEFIEGEWYVVGSQDNPDDIIRITPGMWDTFWAARGETGGAVLGGIAGGKAGAEATAGSPNPYVRALAIGGGSIAGAVAGSIVGTQLDYLRDAILLSEELSAEVSAHKALTAAEASAIGDLVSLGVLKAGASTLKGVVRAKDFIVGGNTEGAKQALRDTMFLREPEIEEVVAKLSKVIDTSTMSQAQQEITATALLLPGTQDLVRVAGVIDPKASRAVVRAINDRAADVLKTTNELAGEGAPVKLSEDLNAYTQQTKEYYGSVKMAAATAPRAKYYKFKLEPAALEPVYEQLRANIQDPATLEKFILQVNKAKQHANGRTFEDLIELRQLVNDFAFNRKITNGKAIGTLREVIDNLDARIEQGSKFVFGADKAKQWLAEFSSAKAEYAKMKSLERNSLVKLVRRPGVQPELISQALLRYANSVDGTYEHVMGVLPKASRVTVEGDMINTLAEKYSLGEAGGPRAVHFPLLVQELDKLQLVTPEARKLKAGLKELGEIFQNDVPLSMSTGLMAIPKFQSYLTADPVIRAKFALASGIFNYVKTLAPGEASRQAALLKNTAKFLETPLNAKSLKEFSESLAPEVNFGAEVLEVQRAQGEAIAKGLDKSAARMKFYGDGDIVSTSGKGLEIAIPTHRIASKTMAEAIANREAISTKDRKALDLVLSKYGFKAIEYGSDKVRLLKP